jgi:hypothetical protein
VVAAVFTEAAKIVDTEMHQVAGIFRDPVQARLAVEAARKRGMATDGITSMVQDSAGTHVNVRTGGSAEEARALLLEYGAYSATIVN